MPKTNIINSLVVLIIVEVIIVTSWRRAISGLNKINEKKPLPAPKGGGNGFFAF